MFEPDFVEFLEIDLTRAIQMRLSGRENLSAVHLTDYFFWNARVKTYTAGEINGTRRHIGWGMPYLHPNVFDLILSIPTEWKVGYGLYAEWFNRRFPQFINIPNGNTGAPVGQSKSLWRRFEKNVELLRYYVMRLSQGRIKGKTNCLPAYFQCLPQFRSALLDLLRERRVVESGIVKKNGIEAIINRIDRGESFYFHFLIRLLSIELMLKEIVG